MSNKGPVRRKYRIEFDTGDQQLSSPPPDAPLRQHRRWVEAFMLLYPGCPVRLRSLPALTATDVRELKAVVNRAKGE